MKKCGKKRFKELFKRGLGRALLILDESKDREPYRDIVLWGCLHPTSYDEQIEGVRRDYIFEAVNKFDDRAFFENAIIDKFSGGLNDGHTFNLLAELLFAFAQEGSEAAAFALEKTYQEVFLSLLNKKIFRSETRYPQGAYLERLCILKIEMGDFSVFKKLLTDIKTLANRHPHFDDSFYWFFSIAEDEFGSKKTLKAVQASGLNYEPYVRGTKDARKDDDKKTDINKFIADCKNSTQWRISRYPARFHLDEKELPLLAEAAVKENDSAAKARMLWLFRFMPFPLDAQILIDYSKSNDKELSDSAFEALSEVPSEKVRAYALELLEQNQRPEYAIGLLAKNYQKSDAQLLTDAVKNLRVEYNTDWHGAFANVRDLLKANQDAPQELFFYLYENTLCSFCRECVVRAMAKKKLINRELLQELKLDCNSDIRELAAKLESKSKKLQAPAAPPA